MRASFIRLAAVALTSGLALSGCAYDMYGNDYGYGYGYSPYGYSPYGYGPRSSVSIGIGYGGGYGGYGYGGYPYGGYYGGYGYGSPYGGYGYDPFGWYGNYYYPGSGIYVYDVNRTRHVWSGDQQRYWTDRRQRWQNRSGTSTTTSTGENWSGWDRSRWRDRGTTSTSTGTWTRGSHNWTRSGTQSGASTSTTSTETRDRGGRGHRRGDRDD
jgi:hypothetical protein